MTTVSVSSNWNELPSVSIILLNWNGRPFLEACLASLFKSDYDNFNVLLIDNASTDDSVAFVSQHFPRVKIHCNQENLGFAAGNNVGLRQIDTDIVVLLNPDTVVSNKWLRELVHPFLEDESIGIVGCKLYYPKDNLLQHAGGYLISPQAISGHFGYNEVDVGQYDTLRDVDYIIGAAMALRSKTLDEIGLLDEGFFLYFEDVDLCARAKEAGYRVVYTPKATLVHVESATSKKDSDNYLRHMYTSRWRFLLKHYEINDILGQTIPAEKAWLFHLPLKHRRAAAKAYRTSLKNIAEIWVSRFKDRQHCSGQITQIEKLQVAQELQLLSQVAWKVPLSHKEPDDILTQTSQAEKTNVPPPLIEQLDQQWNIREYTFVSNVPIFGAAIAWLRHTWNNVAARWYVLFVLKQINTFHHTLVRWAKQLEQEISYRVVDLEEDVIELAQQQTLSKTTAQRLEALEKEVNLLHGKLHALEKETAQKIKHESAR